MNGKSQKLFTIERRWQIETILRKQLKVTVNELCHEFSVSKVTIRKDLAWLEKNHIILRTHGGALFIKP